MDSFEKNNFVTLNQFEAALRAIDRNNAEYISQFNKLSNEIYQLRRDFDSRIDKLNNMSLFQLIKLKLKHQKIC